MKESSELKTIYHTDDINVILDFINEFPPDNKSEILKILENNLEIEGDAELIGFVTTYDNGTKEYCLIIKDRINNNKPLLFTSYNKEAMTLMIKQLTADEINFDEIYGESDEE